MIQATPTTGRLFLALFLVLLGASATIASTAQSGRVKGSPFNGLRWAGASPEVAVDGEWYEPELIHGVAVPEILAFCEERWPGLVKKRFGEDLVEALNLMGHEVPSHVDLRLRRLDSGEVVEVRGVAVTRAKREAIRTGVVFSTTLKRAAAVGDLDELRDRLVDQFAYLELGDFDWESELDRLRDDLAPEVPVADFASAIGRFMASFRDGHARVESDRLPRPSLYPPFLLADAEGGVVALLPDRSGFVDAEHPFVRSIGGVGIDAWIRRVEPTVAAGSPQLVRRRALGELRALELFRQPGDTGGRDTVTVTLASEGGRSTVDRELAMTPRRPTYGSWPRSDSSVLTRNVGYLRLPQMDDDLVPDLHAAMDGFRDTVGLVVDVRGNGGGSRDLLIALAGYLQGPDESPWVGNVARYALSDRFEDGHLEARFMYRADDPRWSEAQRRAIAALAADFEPEWQPRGEFSDWHYLVLGRTGRDGEYFYDQPVVVLSDSQCFSATDIFLGALIGRPRITVMGAPSGGGSARSMGFTLPASGIRVRCASMASFRPDGRLYDGRGVEVDIELPTRPRDLLLGGTDSVLDAALEQVLAGR